MMRADGRAREMALAVALTATALVAACAGLPSAPEALVALPSAAAPTGYVCADESRLSARYFRLTDGSLAFARVTLADGRVLTLPQVASGSGARYTDERDYVWWTKGASASLQARGADGEWSVRAKDCRALAAER